MKKFIFLIMSFIFLTACSSTTPSHSEEQSKNKENLATFFLKNNSTATFKGEGNEYASYTLKTIHLFDHYIATYEDNGGTVLEKIYRISDNRISIISIKGEAYEVKAPSLDELDAMPELEVYLATPLKVSSEFDGWKITSITETIETGLQTMKDVIVIEKIDEQGFSIRKYFAKNFGEIKSEFIMQQGDEEFIVTSTLESVK